MLAPFFSTWLLALILITVSALDVSDAEGNARTASHHHDSTEARASRRSHRDRNICEVPSQLVRRADVPGTGNVSLGVSTPSVGLTLGNITTKLGNINLTVTNVTIAAGNIDIENISIGNITVIVSVPLPGASPISAFSALTPGSSIATSTAQPTSTVSPGVATSYPASTSVAPRTTAASPLNPRDEIEPFVDVGANVTGNPITASTGNVYTEIGNITIFVGHVNVSLGDIKIKNVTIGDVFVLVQIGQPDLAGLANTIGNATQDIVSGIPRR